MNFIFIFRLDGRTRHEKEALRELDNLVLRHKL
jgi:hypothetical protein